MMDSGPQVSSTQDRTAITSQVKVLAAAKPGAKALMLGASTSVYGASILEGLDMYSRLLAVISNESDRRRFQSLLDLDIRFALHCQAYAAFLADMTHHVFDLIVCGREVLASLSMAQIETAMPPGGILVVLPETDARTVQLGDPANQSQTDRFSACYSVIIAGDAVLAVKLASDHRPNRGARRRRIG